PRFNWPPVCAVTRSRNKSSYRTSSPSYVSAKNSFSKTWAKLASKASVTQSAPMPPRGGKRRCNGRIRRRNVREFFTNVRPLLVRCCEGAAFSLKERAYVEDFSWTHQRFGLRRCGRWLDA